MPPSGHTDLVVVAKITKLFGDQGEVIVRLFDNFPKKRDLKEPMFIRIDEHTVPFFVSSFQTKGQSKAAIVFDDVDTPYRATQLLNREILLPMAANEEEDEFGLDGLIGLRWVDNRSGRDGEIIDFIDDPNNPLFVTEIDGIEIFIPAAEELIAGIDEEKGEILFDLPEGLIDLYV